MHQHEEFRYICIVSSWYTLADHPTLNRSTQKHFLVLLLRRFPDNVVELGEACPSGCKNLRCLRFPSSLKLNSSVPKHSTGLHLTVLIPDCLSAKPEVLFGLNQARYRTFSLQTRGNLAPLRLQSHATTHEPSLARERRESDRPESLSITPELSAD